MNCAVVAIPLGSPRPAGRRQAGSQRHFGVSAWLSGLNCRAEHFDSPGRPGRIMCPQGLAEHRGWQAPTHPWFSQNALPLLGSVWDEHPSWKIPLEFPWEMQRVQPQSCWGQGTHFVEAVDWMPPLEVRVQYFPV